MTPPPDSTPANIKPASDPSPGHPGAKPPLSFLASKWLWVLIIGLLLAGAILPALLPEEPAAPMEVILLQVNDVYEIAGLDNDSIGGLARIAALKQQLLRKNKNTLLILAGDFISPSVFNSVKKNDTAVGGEQMVESMNAAKFDLVIFGNHEFDFSYNILQRRMDESNFQWLASNVYHKAGKDSTAFQKNRTDLPRSWIKKFTDGNGRSVSIGFIGLTIPDNMGDPAYASYSPTLATAKQLYDSLSKICDAVIAITHQDEKDDIILAKAIPGLAAILGGHEHDQRKADVGPVPIRKAYANARDACEWRIVFNKKNTRPEVYPTFIRLNMAIPKDSATATVVAKWTTLGKNYFIGLKYNPDSPVCPLRKDSLDGKDEHVRSGSTTLTRLITNAMLWVTKKKYHTQIALMNAGSVRVDDLITPPITEYSFLRALPYRGPIQVADFKGDSLKMILDLGATLSGDGAFLQYSENLRKDPTTRLWVIDNVPIDDARSYRVAIADYLIRGLQKKMEFIKPYNRVIDFIPKDSTNTDLRFDVVKATIAWYRQTCSASPSAGPAK
ncbi:MAG TPA: bifunctional metallophosphatase/5'-nucleotidase [Puia sp.]|jgi:2',3'-cyclic-nucleotide 2'-phosphodiesterase (5'-nucleotidase family)